MNKKEAINYIESRAVFGSKPGFERINALLLALDHPEKGLKYIHVAGTNGKGSTCTAIANILTASGLKTGLFTSPFVSDFRERIQLDGEYIDEDSLASLTEKVKAIVDKLDEQNCSPTEFEVITAIAFLYYKQENCDVVVLEVGLGGLLDSTNVIDCPLVSAITSLSFDHMGVLGNSIEEIAAQKAGIIKEGGITISSPSQPEGALEVLRKTAEEKNNKFIVANESMFKVKSESIDGLSFTYKDLDMTFPLFGPHQIKNLAIVLSVIEELRLLGYEISDDAIKLGVSKTTLPARIEIISKDPLIILDGGHNEDGARALRDSLCRIIPEREKIFVIGVMEDKEVDEVIKLIAPLAKHVVTTTASNPRAATAENLKAKIAPYCSEITACDDPCKAFGLARGLQSGSEALIVCGSLYLAGDVRAHMIESVDTSNA